ncbi:MAG: hypothetical protein C0616_15125 [Desulfuromonas sp.]|nr:MAG: hypothetical protein C0616_15125 [Desulfuromonas sp.]
MDVLTTLQQWYLSQCNEEWEHSRGISIGTLDNPGWLIEVDLAGTDLDGIPFTGRRYGIGDNGHPVGRNWLDCKVEGSKFRGYGGPEKLNELITVFLEWAQANLKFSG